MEGLWSSCEYEAKGECLHNDGDLRFVVRSEVSSKQTRYYNWHNYLVYIIGMVQRSTLSHCVCLEEIFSTSGGTGFQLVASS